MIVNPLMKYMGGVRFSMYLWHPLVIVNLFDVYSVVVSNLGTGIWGFVLCSFAALAAVGLIALVLFGLVEQPGINFGKMVVSRV